MQVRRRRRARTFAPEMLDAVREALSSEASAREVVQAIARRQARGELAGLDAPSESTVKSIAREMARDESAAWTLEDSTPAEAPLVLRVLSAVAHESHGRVRHLTKREAHLSAIYLAARPGIGGAPPRRQAWRAYVQARAYLAMLNRGDDLAAEHLQLADLAEVEQDLEYRPGMVDPMLKSDPPLKENAGE
jgi:hypothetical protein